jgi:hypothetical protein
VRTRQRYYDDALEAMSDPGAARDMLDMFDLCHQVR